IGDPSTAQLATSITGITLAANADYSSDTKWLVRNAATVDTLTLTVTAVNDGKEEGPESFTALLVNTTSNASVTEDGSGAVNVTDNDSATVTLSDVSYVSESATTDSPLSLHDALPICIGDPSTAQLATSITGITLAANADYSSDTK